LKEDIEQIMKKLISLLIPLIIISCIRNPLGFEHLKYSEEDLVPLNDSTKTLYYKDAAFIEFLLVSEDSLRRYEQVHLNENNTQEYYIDLLNIYNNSYSLGNSFFENISKIHTYCTHILYYISASVDTSKLWITQWINDNPHTGIIGIDSLIENYDLDIFIYKRRNRVDVKLKSDIAINPYALIQKFQNTGEFRYVSLSTIVGGGNKISLDISKGYKIYQYSLKWGDCPMGCSYRHYWKIKIYNDKITLFEESGDPLG